MNKNNIKRKKLRTNRVITNKRIYILIAVILFITVGFSVLTTTLNINGKVIAKGLRYTVSFSSNSNGSLDKSSAYIFYGLTNTVKVTPSSGYYISSISCTNGYTTNVSINTTSSSAQTVTIYNNKKVGNSTCTISYNKISYTKTSKTCGVTGYNYSFGSQTVSYNQSSCSTNNISCDASHVGQTNVTCSGTTQYSWSSSSVQTGQGGCSANSISCDASHVGQKNVTCSIDGYSSGDYYMPQQCAAGTVPGHCSSCSLRSDGRCFCSCSTPTYKVETKTCQSSGTLYTKTTKKCNSSPSSYGWISENRDLTASTCTVYNISCDASHVGQTNIACKNNN